MAIKTYLYRAAGIATSDLTPLLAAGAAPVLGNVINVDLTPITIDEVHKPDLDDAMASLGYAFVAEYTDPAPLVARTDYGVLTADPTSPVPTVGDYYYNDALQMEMKYDGLRTKFLSVESNEFTFGRNGATALGQYYRTVDGRVMSATIGWYAFRSGTIVSLGYTRSNLAASTFEIMRNGVVIASVGSAAISGRDITLNADFTFGDVLAVRNRNPGGITQDVVGWLRMKWRV